MQIPQENIFDTGKVKLNYLDYGSSLHAPLVMLHGGAWCWEEYLSLIPVLSESWHIYALDLRGNGKSGWAAEHYRLEDFSDDNAEFVKSLGSPVVLMGHSLGGVIALMVAARYPERVRALIIEDSPLALDDYKRFVDSSREMFTLWLDLKRSANSREDLSVALAEKFKGYPGANSAWILFFAECLWRLDPAFFTPLLHDFDGFSKGYDGRQILTKIDCPILVLRGERELGAVMTDDEILWLKENYSSVNYAPIEGVGHLLHLQEQGQAPVMAQITTFLARVQRKNTA